MVSNQDYINAIQQTDDAALVPMCREILNGRGHTLLMPDGQAWQAGKALEYLIIRAFEIELAAQSGTSNGMVRVHYPYTVHIAGQPVEQIDGLVFVDHLACLIEAKDQADKIDVVPIAKMRSQILRRPAQTIGLIFCRSVFSDSAITLAQYSPPQTILLWEGQELLRALETQSMIRGLHIKYNNYVQQGAQQINITELL